jgi:phosphoglycolate phosphatase
VKPGQPAPRRAAPAAAGGGAARWHEQPLDAVLFDLDGTLLDTVADIALALNRAFAEQGWPPLAEAEVRRMIGRGAPTLVARAAAAQRRTLAADAHAALVERFFAHYGALQDDESFSARPYPGAEHALRELRAAGLRLAVVTNKQQRFATGLLQRLGLSGWVDLVVGGDSCERRKPDPQPLLFACEALHAAPERALMVGDSVNDVQAARAAGIAVVCVPHGYNEGQDPRSLACDAIVETLDELPALLLRQPQPV